MLFPSNTVAQDLPLPLFTQSFSLLSNFPSNSNPNFNFFFMRASPYSAFALLRALSNAHHGRLHLHRPLRFTPFFTLSSPSLVNSRRFSRLPSASVEQLVDELAPSNSEEVLWDFSTVRENEVFDFDKSPAAVDLKHLSTPELVVKDLSELPEEWRRARLAWLCKELPAHKAGTLIRILNGQKKWMRQEDATYLVVHCMRIRENETGFRVYKWMMQQHWFRFDFALATKLADYMGKERKFSKCREIFDDIINQGRVPKGKKEPQIFYGKDYVELPVDGISKDNLT